MKSNKSSKGLVIAVSVVVATLIIVAIPSSVFEKKSAQQSNLSPVKVEDNIDNSDTDSFSNYPSYAIDDLSNTSLNKTTKDFVNKISYNSLDFSWFSGEAISGIKASTGNMYKVYTEDSTWGALKELISKTDKSSYDSIVFHNLKFIKYLDEKHTCLVCAYDLNGGTDNNLIIIKDTTEPIGVDYAYGDIVNSMSYIKDMKFQTVEESTILYCVYESHNTKGGE